MRRNGASASSRCAGRRGWPRRRWPGSTKEREALDRSLAGPRPFAGVAMSDALKRRAELVRGIERAEAEWLAAAEALDREPEA